MPWKKIEGNKPSEDGENLDSQIANERHVETLLRNGLIAGNQEVVDRIVKSGEIKRFSKGETIIKQGESDDCVFFILFGSVNVIINKRHIDNRSSPHTVGEMAAKKAGEPRTADVIVHTDILETFILSGSEFRQLMRDFPDFSTNLDNLIDDISRKKIHQLGELADNKSMPWTKLSAIIASIVFLLVFPTIYFFTDLGFFKAALTSITVWLLTFIIMLLVNPVLRYRNLASMAGYALIALVSYGSLSFILTINGKELDFPLIDFSVQTDLKLGYFAIGAFFLLALTMVSGVLDLKLGKSQLK